MAGRVPLKGSWPMGDWAQIMIKDQDPQYFFAYILYIIECTVTEYDSADYELDGSQKEPEKIEKDLKRTDCYEEPKYLSAKVTIKG